MKPSIELIIIGDELLLGKKQDANASWFGRYLFTQGFKLSRLQLVSDQEEEIISAFELALSRSNLVVSSGGLGPTLDDLTKASLAKLLSRPLEESSQALSVCERNFEKLGRNYAQNNYPYHLLPKGAVALDNPAGLAPGIILEYNNKQIFLLPGVPKEFQSMISEHLFTQTQLADFKTLQTNLLFRTWGIGEEELFSHKFPTLWKDLSQWGQVSSLPHVTGVDIGILIEQQNQGDLIKAKEQVEDIIKQCGLISYVWERNQISLEEQLVVKFKEKKKTLAFAESCTGGLASHLITNVAGCSDMFRGSVVCYQNEMKHSLLSIPLEDLQNHGEVSEQVAKLMAKNARELSGADIAVSFTGYAGPSGGHDQTPVGSLWIGVATQEQVVALTYCFAGTRESRKLKFATAGLHQLRLWIDKC